MMTKNPNCPICQSESQVVMPLPSWGEMRQCTGCGLSFVNPMKLQVSSEELYTKAYAGEVSLNDMQHFAKRIQNRNTLLRTYRFFPPQEIALNLRWIRRNLPKGATVLDIGCGPGYFLYALRRLGYKPIGIEPGEKPASILKKEGFHVWQGTLDNYPTDWPVPDAITSFFVLHHLPDPNGFFSTLRERFPRATVLTSDHHNNTRIFATGDAQARNLPPRFLTWWTGPAIEAALTEAGYDVTIRELPYSVRQALSLGTVVSLLNTGTSLPAFLLWLLRGERKSGTKSESTAPDYPTSFSQRFRRFTGIPWSLWAVASPSTIYHREGRDAGPKDG